MRSTAPTTAALRRVALAACLACVAASSQAGVLDFLFGSSKEASPSKAAPDTRRRTWHISEFSGVRVVPAEAGAPANSQPVALSANTLRDVLNQVRAPGASGGEALFAREELDDLLDPLTEALQVAGPREDVLLVSSSRRNGGLLSMPMAVTARLFVVGDKLNLIVHDTRYDFFGPYRGANKQPEFVYGSRTAASSAAIDRPGAVRRRGDWLELPLSAAAAAVPAAPGVPAAAAAPPAPAATLAAPAPAVAPTAPPQRRDPAFFEEQERRLEALKRLRDRGLITEDEYQQKRGEILKTL